MFALLWRRACRYKGRLRGVTPKVFRHQARIRRSSALAARLKNRENKVDQRYLRKITAVLWPPNPKVLLMAAFTVRFCAVLNVKFNRGSISGSSVK